MKKLMLISCLAILSISTNAIADEEALLPEVEALIQLPQLSDEVLNRNAYLMQSALLVIPEKYDENLAHKIVLTNDQYLRSILKGDITDYPLNKEFSDTKELANIKNQLSIVDDYSLEKSWDNSNLINIDRTLKNIYYVCTYEKYFQQRCITDLLKYPGLVKRDLQRNALLLERYRASKKALTYQSAWLYGLESRYYKWDDLSSFEVADAFLLMKKGNIEEGLIKLHSEITFLRQHLSGIISLYECERVRWALFQNYFLLVELLDADFMVNHLDHPLIEELLAPLSDQELTLFNRMQKVADREQLIEFWVMDADSIVKSLENQTLPYQNYDAAKTMNAWYRFVTESGYQETLNVTQLEAKEFYRKIATLSKEERKAYFSEFKGGNNEEYILNRYGKENYLGGVLLSRLINNRNINDDYRYFFNLYNLDLWIHLVGIKHAIYRDGVGKDDVEAYLERNGLTLNPYSNEALHWDKEKGELSTPNLINVLRNKSLRDLRVYLNVQ